MGKPYDHEFYFAGSGGSCGTMVCVHCQNSINSETQDWMAWKKSKGGDWVYRTAHRRCVRDQSGWERQVKAKLDAEDRYKAICHDLREVARKNNITDAHSFAEAAADALGGCLDSFYSY